MSSVTPAGSVCSATNPGVVPVCVATTRSARGGQSDDRRVGDGRVPDLVPGGRVDRHDRCRRSVGCSTASAVTIGAPIAKRFVANRHARHPTPGRTRTPCRTDRSRTRPRRSPPAASRRTACRATTPTARDPSATPTARTESSERDEVDEVAAPRSARRDRGRCRSVDSATPRSHRARATRRATAFPGSRVARSRGRDRRCRPSGVEHVVADIDAPASVRRCRRRRR